MRDIVERLRILSDSRSVAPATTREAAEEIERLRWQIDNLRALITAWADADDALVALFGTNAAWDTVNAAEKKSDAALDALRKAVGR